MKYIVATSNNEKYRDIKAFLSSHNIRPEWFQTPNYWQRYDLERDAIEKAEFAFRRSQPKETRIILTESHAVGTSILCEYDGKTSKIIRVSGRRSQERALSNYILDNHSYAVADLSCRSDAPLLETYVRNGNVAFDRLPTDWIENNLLFKKLDYPMYRRLLNVVVNTRGMFLKVWSLNCQKNYWNSSLNAGLPLIRKRDAIHEGTYLLHDIFHFLFIDPVITGSETLLEMRTYIAYRMLSEACTMVLADMIGVAQAGLEEEQYDTRGRKIYPLFKSLGLDPDSTDTVYKLMRANCLYCLKADDSEYLKLGAAQSDLAAFKEKYSTFFSVDFRWNEKNIRSMLSYTRANPFLRLYYENLPDDLRRFNTRSFAKMVLSPSGGLSFERLFALFSQQVELMLAYEEALSYISYLKAGISKYLAGQIYVAFKFASEKGASDLIVLYRGAITRIRASSDVDEILKEYSQIIGLINTFIDDLATSVILLPHEQILYKLHVPHFPAVYYGYDHQLQPDESLAVVSSGILGSHID